MQSSAVVTLRVAVMLTCLTVAPMAAIFGSSLPKVVTSLLHGKGFPRTERAPTVGELRAAGGEAPVFNASVQMPGQGAPPDGFPPRAAEAAPMGPAGGATGTAPGSPGPAVPPSALAPTPNVPPGPVRQSAQMDPDPAAPAALGDATQQIEKRLRELGATYYLLEYLAANDQHYRFHCKMSIVGSPNHTRTFEAIENNPVQAMRLVLDQVQQWRGAQQAN